MKDIIKNYFIIKILIIPIFKKGKNQMIIKWQNFIIKTNTKNNNLIIIVEIIKTKIEYYSFYINYNK